MLRGHFEGEGRTGVEMRFPLVIDISGMQLFP